MSETRILRCIQVAASKFGARLFRNQVGHYELKDGRRISSGLCKGSSDLVGWYTLTVTPAMVGTKIAVFTAVEVKTTNGHVTKEQDNFIAAVNAAGGRAFVARSVDEALNNF